MALPEIDGMEPAKIGARTLLPGFHWPLGFTLWGWGLWLGVAVFMLLVIGFALIFNPAFVLDRY